MTLRARPVARRRGRAGWDSGDRRNSLINAGFFLAIVVSVLILVGYAAWTWYDSHFGAAATVNGQVIGRLGNFVNQELYGPPTTLCGTEFPPCLPWGVQIGAQFRAGTPWDAVTFPVETTQMSAPVKRVSGPS